MTTPKETGTTTKKKSRYAVRLPTNASQQQQQQAPRAVVLVFGWAFSRMKHVLKYAELYEERGCATITGILEPRSVAVKNDAAIARFVRGAMEEASRLIRELEGRDAMNGKPIPILIHAFCNGGGFCRIGFHQALTTEGGTPNEATKELIRDRIVAEVLDSCPVYISTGSSLAALKGVVTNPLFFWALAVFGTCANYCKYFWSLLVEGEAFYVTYWNQAKQSNVCPHQFVVFSTADPVAEPARVKEFVDYRRAQSQGSVTVVKFEDTGHCCHLQGHKTEYCQLVDVAIERAVREMEDRAKVNPRLQSRL